MSPRLVRPPEVEPYPHEVDRIVAACRAHGYAVSREDAQWAWEQESVSYCASWLLLPKDETELFGRVLAWFDLDDAEVP
jgi:hypothetical protein